jgi:hypothetical protein
MTLPSTVLLLGVAVPAGVLAGAWSVAVARSIGTPDMPLVPLRGERAQAQARARGPERRRCRVARVCWDPALTAGAGIPIVAAMISPRLDAAAAASVLGWLLLAIAVCDERTLHIPHAPSAAGIAGGLALGGAVGGWPGAVGRALGALGVVLFLAALAMLARRVRGREPVGRADYGVVACLGAVCGPWVTLDVLLVGGLLALFTLLSPYHAVRAEPSRCAAPAPLGACLVAAAALVMLGAAALPRLAPASVRSDFVLRHLLPGAP